MRLFDKLMGHRGSLPVAGLGPQRLEQMFALFGNDPPQRGGRPGVVGQPGVGLQDRRVRGGVAAR